MLSVPGVAWAETMFFGWMFALPGWTRHNVELVGLDDSLVGGPWKMAENDTSVVLSPDAVVIDSFTETN